MGKKVKSSASPGSRALEGRKGGKSAKGGGRESSLGLQLKLRGRRTSASKEVRGQGGSLEQGKV